MHIPNIITLARIGLVPLVVWLIITNRMQVAFCMFVLAGLSDALDGFLAKRFNWQTELGAYLDPLADKALLVSIYVALGVQAHIPSWLVILVVSRDVLIIGAFLLSWILGRPVEVQPLLVSKANTTGQIILAAWVLWDLGFALGLDMVRQVLIWTTATLTVLSAAAYLEAWLRHMARYDTLAPRPRADQSSKVPSGRRGRDRYTGSKQVQGSDAGE